ncbi:M20/M25/M40 family metallo-hydrolase [Natranaerobius trueperi]|uniref:Peptidase M20 n=1 Tax=Natranaerobius trueperi TaxID=759412 RepID=A0A226C148_9FIRM|nr:M20/M25/M40 family metallo-hydrolase [Natranaerobius trueperi]OWZ84334.1 peptidase M20 [Natranaerobius trueperi]
MIRELLENKRVQKGLEFIKHDEENTLQQQIEICEVPAPTFNEEKRSQFYYELFLELGMDEVKIDKIGNVIGVIKGTEGSPKTITMAHIDTVFPEDTDLKVKEKDNILYAPGLSDNSRSLAAQLSVIRAIKESGIKLKGDIIFTANVCEEGLGDLQGAKALFNNIKDIDYGIAIDGTAMGVGGIIYGATGSKRYEVEFKGEGGHSFNTFGKPSAIHALGRAISKISDIEVPDEPKTTFNVGVVEGGTTVNTIASQAKMLIDMRSNDANKLAELEKQVMDYIKEAVKEEKQRFNSNELEVNCNKVGDRPAGMQDSDDEIVTTAIEVNKALGIEPKLKGAGSSDANIPISKKIPAIALSGGGKGGNVHSKEEWFGPKDAYLGVQKLYLLLLSLAKIAE